MNLPWFISQLSRFIILLYLPSLINNLLIVSLYYLHLIIYYMTCAFYHFAFYLLSHTILFCVDVSFTARSSSFPGLYLMRFSTITGDPSTFIFVACRAYRKRQFRLWVDRGWKSGYLGTLFPEHPSAGNSTKQQLKSLPLNFAGTRRGECEWGWKGVETCLLQWSRVSQRDFQIRLLSILFACGD